MKISRRSFVKASAIAVAGMALPTVVRPRSSRVMANDQINVALIGCGDMGKFDLADMLVHPEVHCVALADIDSRRLAATAGEMAAKNGKKPELYGDYRKVLDRKDVDFVIIATPDHWHARQFVDACSAGKDVYVEKPIANSIAECDAMVAAQERYGTIVQVGQQQRSSGHWQEMVDYLKTGKLGTIGRVQIWANFGYGVLGPAVPDADPPQEVDYDFWLGPTPKLPFNIQRFHGWWRMFWNYGGGLQTDWGVHLLDMGLWAMDVQGMPLSVSGTGGKWLFPDRANETFDTQMVSYRFDDFMMTWEHNAGVNKGFYNRSYGVSFKGTNGTLVADRDNWEVIPEGNSAEAIKVVADQKDHLNHVSNFLECLKNRNPQTACTIQNGSLCAKYAHLGNIASRMETTLAYDDIKHTFDKKAANSYLKPIYRKPWKFPEI